MPATCECGLCHSHHDAAGRRLTVAGLQALARWLAAGLDELDMDCLSGADADALTGAFDEVVRICSAGRLAAARRATSCNVWRLDGRHRSPGQWLAERTGVPVGEAQRQLATAQHLEALPEAAGAFRRGELSPDQAEQVAKAAADDPSSEHDLLEVARRKSLRDLKAAARQVRNRAAAADDAARAERLQQRRRAWFAVDDEGMGVLSAQLPPEQMARLRRAVEAEAAQVSAAARCDGRHETTGACQADALLALVERGASGGNGGRVLRPRMLIRADLSALQRGFATDGEVCDIPGCGEIPVATARRLLGDALLALVITDGVDIRTVCSVRRHVPVALDLALRWRDATCVVPGCGQAVGLERDHWSTDFGKGGPTELANPTLLCRQHHRQKTYNGYRLAGGPGQWRWTSPAEVGAWPERAGEDTDPGPDQDAQPPPDLADPRRAQEVASPGSSGSPPPGDAVSSPQEDPGGSPPGGADGTGPGGPHGPTAGERGGAQRGGRSGGPRGRRPLRPPRSPRPDSKAGSPRLFDTA